MPNPLPADLPENWTLNQIVSPTGTDVGLTEKHGYNYQAKQINDAQRAINDNTAAIATKATKAVPAAAGNLAGLAADGDLLDSGVQAGDFVNKTATADQEIKSLLILSEKGLKLKNSASDPNVGGRVTIERPTNSLLGGDIRLLATGESQLSITETGGAWRSINLDFAELNTNSRFWHSGNFPVEEGTWTPALAGITVAGANTYSARSGSYYRLGKLVFITFSLRLSTKDASMAGKIVIKNLPFTSDENHRYPAAAGGYTNGFTGLDGTLSFRIYSNVIDLVLNNNNFVGTVEVMPTNITSTTQVEGMLTYKIA